MNNYRFVYKGTQIEALVTAETEERAWQIVTDMLHSKAFSGHATGARLGLKDFERVGIHIPSDGWELYDVY